MQPALRRLCREVTKEWIVPRIPRTVDARGTAEVLYVEGRRLGEVILRPPPHRAREDVSRHRGREHAWVGHADKVP